MKNEIIKVKLPQCLFEQTRSFILKEELSKNVKRSKRANQFIYVEEDGTAYYHDINKNIVGKD